MNDSMERRRQLLEEAKSNILRSADNSRGTSRYHAVYQELYPKEEKMRGRSLFVHSYASFSSLHL